jgi:hypothetical protein
VITGVGTAVVRREPAAIVAFVTDLEQYKRADHKIGRVLVNERRGDRFFLRHDGALRGIPGPPVSLELRVTETTATQIRVVDFFGGFDLDVVEGGTRVVHTENFRFYLPFSVVAEPLLRDWLQRDIEAEMVRMKQILEDEG